MQWIKERTLGMKAAFGLAVFASGILLAALFGQVGMAYAETYGAATPAGFSEQAAPSGVAYIRVGTTIIYENKAITQNASDRWDSPQVPVGAKSGSVKGVSYDARTNTLTLSKYSAKASKTYLSWSFASGSGCKSHIFVACTFDSGVSVNVVLKGTNTLRNTYRNPEVDKPYFIGAEGCNLTVKGSGTLKTEKCNGIKCTGNLVVKSGTYRIDRCGTWGGGFCARGQSITIAKAAKLYLKGADKQGGNQVIRADECTNDPTSLKEVWGTLCYGAKFKAVRQFSDGSKLYLGIFQVNSKDNQTYSVKVVRKATLGGSADESRYVSVDHYLSRLTHTTYTPRVTGIALGAFKMGSKTNKVKSAIVGEYVNEIEKQAFKPLKKMKKIYIRCGSKSKILYSKNGKFASRDCANMSPKAFAGVNKSCIVTVKYYNKDKLSKSKIASQCKKILMKYGLPKSTKVKVEYGYLIYA